MHNNLKITAEKLPDTLPIFPLNGVLLLPNIELPLNIFEPRYINMVDDALATPNKLIGLAQPTEAADGIVSKLFGTKKRELYNVGCVGKIKSYNETEDGRYLIILQGICRFEVGEEIDTMRGYRRFKVDFSKYIFDIKQREENKKTAINLDRKMLVEMVDFYLKKNNIDGSINNIEGFDNLDSAYVVDFLCSHLPFIPQEKQLFLEAKNPEERSKILFDILGLAINEIGFGGNSTLH
jgi:Lon protease-like protein